MESDVGHNIEFDALEGQALGDIGRAFADCAIALLVKFRWEDPVLGANARTHFHFRGFGKFLDRTVEPRGTHGRTGHVGACQTIPILDVAA